MPKLPAAMPPFSPADCKLILPEAALKFRIDNGLTSPENLRRLNITAWLYLDKQGNQGVQVNPNTTIAQLLAQFGPADTRDAEVGIHSEGQAAEFFRTRPDLQVLQIFSERIPCAAMCAPLLRNYFPGKPVFYYFDRRSWDARKSAGEVIGDAYGLVDAKAQALAKIQYEFEVLSNALNSIRNEHRIQLDLIRKSWNPMGRAVQVFNPVKTPELAIWNETLATLRTVKSMLAAKNNARAAAFLVVARMQYVVAVKKFASWKDGFEAGAHRSYIAIGVIAVATILTAGAFLEVAPEVAEAAVTTQETLTRIEVLSDQVDTFIRIASSEEEPLRAIEEAVRYAQSLPGP